METKPWEKWIPGVLCQKQVSELHTDGYIEAENLKADPSSIDLHLGNKAYILPQGSVKPFGKLYLHHITTKHLAIPLDPDINGDYILDSKQTYLFKVQERLLLKEDAGIHGQATAKSSIGRLDVLARLIVDGMDCYEMFNPKGLEAGSRDMFLEVTPITFSIKVRTGDSLSQLRLFYGDPEDSIMKSKELFKTLLHLDNDKNEDGSLSVDLTTTDYFGDNVSALCACNDKSTDPISLFAPDGSIDPTPYWRRKACDANKRLRITKSNFYILRSRERIALLPEVAVYCKATDETIGEMRIHYAGFAHPWFGLNRKDGKPGTPLIFEVRGHDVNVSLCHGEKMARLIFYRMSKAAAKPKKPKNQGGSQKKDYNDQTLMLSKYFRECKLKKADD